MLYVREGKGEVQGQGQCQSQGQGQGQGLGKGKGQVGLSTFVKQLRHTGGESWSGPFIKLFSLTSF